MPAQHKWQSRRRALLVVMALGITAVLTLVVLAGLALNENHQRQRTLFAQSQSLIELTTDFEKSIGYGGFIHHFKNAVLRVGEREKYLTLARAELANARERLDGLTELVPATAPVIGQLEQTLSQYETGVDYLAANPLTSAEDADAVVRVSDEDAIKRVREILDLVIVQQAAARKELSTLPVQVVRLLSASAALVVLLVLVAAYVISRLNREVLRDDLIIQGMRRTTQMVEDLSTAIVLIDGNGSLVYRNSRAMAEFPRLFGNADIAPLAAFTAACVTCGTDHPLLRALTGQTVNRERTELAFADDPVRFVRVTSGRKADLDGRPLTIIEILDETDAVIAERISDKNQGITSLGMIAGGIAHDFRNVASAIRLSLDSALTHVTNERGRKMMGNAIDAAVAGQGMATRLLEAAERGRSEPKPVSLNEAIDFAIKIARAQVGARTMVAFSQHPAAPVVMADPSLLTSAIINLILNAHEAAEGAGVAEPRITFDLAPAQTYFGHSAWAIQCRDNGPGFTDSALKHHDELFFTTKEDGSGVGLSVIRSLSEESAGFVTVENLAGGGAMVSVVLAEAEGAVATGASEPDPEIIFVEDDPVTHAVLAEGLKKTGCRVRGFHTADEAMGMLDAPALRLLVTDLDLPGRLKGGDLVKRLSAHRPAVKMIVHSKISSGTVAQVRELGAAHIAKGRDILALEALVTEYLR